MRKVKTWTDNLPPLEDIETSNPSHTVYQHFYKGIPVEGSELTEHHDGDDVYLTSATVFEGINLNVNQVISEESALGFLNMSINAENFELDSLGSESAGYLTIIYVDVNDDSDGISAQNFKLVWKFDVRTFDPDYHVNIYVSADDGAILKKSSNSQQSEGTFNHIYYGYKDDLDTKGHNGDNYLFANNNFTLNGNVGAHNIYTTDGSDHNPNFYHDSKWTINANKKYYDAAWGWDEMHKSNGDDHWGNEHWSATSAHYCAQKTWDFYVDYYNQNGLTGTNGGWGRHLRIIADYPTGGGSAYDQVRSNDYFFIGRTGGKYDGTYDLIGHEFTHGVIKNSRPLPYEKLSGAINESLADIFGFMVEYYMNGGYVQDWTIGEDATTLRDIQSPNVKLQPSYYLQSTFWESVTKSCIPDAYINDNCGVHTNSGVMNKWFYLLSMGESQPVTLGGVTQVRKVNYGIGIKKAAYLAYLTMVGYKNYDDLTNNLTFDVIRANTLAEAARLWKKTSREYKSVCEAWYAVNVGSCPSPTVLDPRLASCVWKYNHQVMSKTGLDEGYQEVKVKLVPNPGSSDLLIYIEEPNALDNPGDFIVKIFDVNGKEVFVSSFSNLSNQRINIDVLHAGIYMVNVVKGNWSKSMRLVKN